MTPRMSEADDPPIGTPAATDTPWTPEPWVAESCERHHSHSHNSLICFKLRDATGKAIEGAPNIRRVVACVNGCAGIDPAAVPDLIAALEKLACLGNGDRPGNSIGNQIAQAALAKATGDRP